MSRHHIVTLAIAAIVVGSGFTGSSYPSAEATVRVHAAGHVHGPAPAAFFNASSSFSAAYENPFDNGRANNVISIDWRILAGLDYTNGKTTDTLKKLDGKVVRIPGFVVPLDDFQEDGAEFLLVPYYGACVHTPPPPPNQIVMVEMEGKKSIKLNLFDAVWMSGKLKIASVESPYGTVGYQLVGMKVEPYSAK